jgi:hypothetical protein
MDPLIQFFEFSYPDGYLFLDRGGAVCLRLREAMPGLEGKSVEKTQISMVRPGTGTELFFGIRTAAIQIAANEGEDFGSIAACFTRVLAEALELTSIESFRFRQVVGRACGSVEEAISLMRPLIASESRERMEQVAAPTEWRAVQMEYVQNNLIFQNRIAIESLPTRRSSSLDPVPHITAQLDVKGLVPLPISNLDVAAMIHNMGNSHLSQILPKIAPHIQTS